MKKLAIVVAIVAAMLFPTIAIAYDRDDWPYAWRECPTITRSGVTYVLVDDPEYGDFASVVDVSAKKAVVTIPFAVWEGGKRYDVGSICDGTLSECPKLRDVYLMAELQECTDMTLFQHDDRDVTIHVYTTDDHEWLTREGNDSNVVAEY